MSSTDTPSRPSKWPLQTYPSNWDPDCPPEPWPPQPPPPPCPPGLGDIADTIQSLSRTIASQSRTIARLQASCGCPPPGPCPPCPPSDCDDIGAATMLWGGPYPLAVDTVPPTQVKVWFDTGGNQLNVWNWQTLTWQEVLPTVFVGATPPSGAAAPIGQLYIDAANKLWVKIDDWRELTFPIVGSTPPVNGVSLVASLGPPPQVPATGSLWFEPKAQNLFLWSGLMWVQIGTRVLRNVRYGNYANSWNAGGNRAQAESAGNFLFIAGIRGINPVTQLQQPGCGPQNTQGTVAPNTQPNSNLRIDQIYTNIQTICQYEGISLFECMSLDTYLASNAYISPTATLQGQPQFWGNGPFPNRTHITELQMSGSDPEQEYGAAVPGWPARGDTVEVTSYFWLGGPGAGVQNVKRQPSMLASEVRAIPGVQVGTGFPPMSMAQPSPQPGDPPPVERDPDEPPQPRRRRGG